MTRVSPQRKKPLLIVAGTTGVTAGGMLLVWSVFGERIVRAAYEGRSITALNRLWNLEGARPFEVVFGHARQEFQGILTLVIAVQVLAAIVIGVRGRKPGWLIWPAALLAWWLALETFGAPYLERVFLLRTYAFIRDVDHRPTFVGGAANRHAMRATDEPEAFVPEELNLIFLGDSFTYGYRAKPMEAFPIQVGNLLRKKHPGATLRVANFGWTSSSPLLSWRRLVDQGEEYEPDIVVYSVDMTDFGDDIRYGNMLERRGLYFVYDKLPLLLAMLRALSADAFASAVTWSVDGPPSRFFMSEAPLEETRRWLEPLRENVRRIHAWCEQRGVQFVLVVLPRSYQYSAREAPNNYEGERYTVLGPYSLEPFRWFEELAQSEPYPIVPLLQTFQETQVFPTCFEDDPHWNARGHRVAAQAIAGALSPYVAERLGQ